MILNHKTFGAQLPQQVWRKPAGECVLINSKLT